MMKNVFKHQIARKLIISIILFSTLITVITTSIQLYFEYQRDISSINMRISNIKTSYLEGVTEAVWVADWKQLQIQLDGIRQLPDIEYAAVILDDKERFDSGKPQYENIITKSYELHYQHLDKLLPIGDLTIVASLLDVYKRLFNQMLVILITNAFKTFLVAIFMYFLVVHIVTRHLFKITDYALDRNSDKLKTKLILDKNVEEKRDELDVLVAAINEMEDNLTISMQRLIDAQRIAHVGSWDRDLINNTLEWSDEMFRMFALDPQTCAASLESFINLTHPDDCEKLKAIYKTSVKSKIPYSFDYRLSLLDGTIKYVRGHCEVFYDDNGTPVRSSGTVQDISEQNRMEESIRRTQKMDALGKLTGGIAHDFNNMLGVVTGYAELLEAMLSEQPELMKYASEIHHAGDRGARLTKKLLSFSRKTESKSVRLNLNSVLHEQQNMLEKTLTVRIKLVFELAENLWPVWLDGSDIEDAILNMSINAMYAMENGGQLTFCTRNTSLSTQEAPRLELNAGDYVMLEIIDTGCGMDSATKEKIFDPFYSTKGEQGTGLGLSQVYGFVKRSRGVIKVYSEPEQGTQMTLYFPRYDENMHEHELSVEKDNERQDFKGNETILIVDDETALLDLSREILSQYGYNILCAQSAEQALQILAVEDVDLLLSDVLMPEMDGYQLAAVVQEKYPAIKIQLASGFSDNHHVKTIDDKLHRRLLQKPYKSQVLLQRVRTLLDGDDV